VTLVTRRQTIADALLALALGALGLLFLLDFDGIDAGAHALIAAHTAALAFRRRRPLPAFIAAVAIAVVYALLGYPVVALGPAPLLAAYTAGAELPRPQSLLALGAIQLGMVVAIVVPGDVGTDTALGDGIALAVFWLLGDAGQRRRQLAALLRDQAVAEERTRIARELHDIIAHSLSVVVVQAGTGRLVVDRDPDQAKAALAAIESTSRTALDEMRRLLDVLRQSDHAAAARTPAPSLDDLDRLLADNAAGGLHVDVRIEGDRRPLQPGLELAAFRIVQEALTNVRKHAPDTRRADLAIRYEPDGIAIEVANNGHAAAVDNPNGLGLVGMRERAAMYDGDVTAGPQPTGGFKVTATLKEPR